MIVKQTPWEKRNLGVETSVEFYIDPSDTWNEISSELQKHQEIYQVMHIASGNTDVLMKATTYGFLPIEMNIQLCKKLDDIELPRIYKRFEPFISYSIADEKENDFILQAISEGSIFSTDKVALDPYFGCEYAGKRYAYWTKDVLDQGAVLLCMKYKNQIVAFDVFIEKSENVAEAFLGGTIPEFSNSGLGFLAIYCITQFAKERGFKKLITGVSSNNVPILKLHEMFNYTVESMSYCLIKHL
ncbi:MAG: GNAT family N-acetyltransferase [Lachnospiraceae bacterium]|nr:GNAT family N-acetyltransferase [Lachnospiraceae bacterium]